MTKNLNDKTLMTNPGTQRVVSPLGRSFTRNLLRQLLITSALTLVSYNGFSGLASAEPLREQGDINGANRSGFIVTNDDRFGALAGNMIIGSSDRQSLVHNFATVGGAGSGGGAGLGGAFFVDANAVLTVINTDFKSNRVEGGQGGSTPPLTFFDVNLNVSGRRADVLEVLGISSTPTQFVRGDSGYTISSVAVGSEALPLLQTGAALTFDKLATTSVASTIVPRDGLVRLQTPIEVAMSDVTSISLAVVGSGTATNPAQGGFKFQDSRTISFLRNTPEEAERPTDLDGLDEITVGSVVVVGGEAVTVKAINYNDAGLLDSVTLSAPVSTAQATVDFLPPLSFKAANFSRGSENRFTVLDDSKKFEAGMTVAWELDGETETAVVTSVSGSTITLDRDIPQNIYGFTATKNPVVDSNTIEVPDASSQFAVGDVVYLPDSSGQVAYAGSVVSVTGDRVVFSPAAGNSSSIQELYVDGVGLAIRRPAAIVNSSSNTITVDVIPNEVVTSGMSISGDGFADGTTIEGVTQVSGKWVLQLSQPVEDVSQVGFFRISSPLVKGGSMNGLQPFANSEGADGRNGSSITYSPSALSDGEGIDGNNGQSASDPDAGTGFDGGDGGNGSAGMNVNPGLVYDLISATYGFTAAINGVVQAGLDLSGAISPDILITVTGGVTAPDPVEITAKTVGLGFSIADLVFATTDLGIVIADQALWNRALADGFVGRGGGGGDGGEGSGGADFFGGGAGGTGGNGGDGGAITTHGGDAGSGGRGGDGGFGAGGGQGGAGGTAGKFGFAYDGDPGDGGFAGFGAGEGTNGNGMFGGGGSGLGGAIFVRSSGSLIIQGNSVFELNYVAGGSTSSPSGEAGMSAGTDLFMMKGASVRLEPGLGNEIRFEGDIADDSLATNDGFMNAAGDGADITIAGAGGLVVFNGENTYSGDTILEGATLTALIGAGVNDFSTLRFNGNGFGGAALNNSGGTLTLGTTGTFLLQENYVRRAGTDPNETTWTGSGGFASSEAEGLIVNLGQLDEERKTGQALVWGQDGFFVSEGTGAGVLGTLTFGSEHSAGSIEFTNNVNLSGNNARIAVYGGGENQDYAAEHSAIVSGAWTGGSLRFGDGTSNSVYDGLLIMSGQNSLSEVIAQGGHLSTINIDADGEHGRLLSATGDLFVYPTASVSLFGTEIGRNANVAALGSLYLAGSTNLAGSVENTGYIFIEEASDVQRTDLPTANSIDAVGSLTVANNIINGTAVVVDGVSTRIGEFYHTGTVAVGQNLVNKGSWLGTNAVSVTGTVTNEGTYASRELVVGGALTNTGLIGQGDVVTSNTGIVNAGFWIGNTGTINTPSLTGNGTFCLQSIGYSLDECRDLTPAANAEGLGTILSLNLTSDSAFDGVFAGAGSLAKKGAGVLTLTDDQIFAGTLAVENGAIVSNTTMSDDLDIVVASGASYTANAADTVNTVSNAGTMTLNAAFRTVGAFENLSQNTLHLHQNLSTQDGSLDNPGRMVVYGQRTIALGTGADGVVGTTTDGTNDDVAAGLKGASTGVIEITNGSGLTVIQQGNSVYSGVVNVVTENDQTASFRKAGAGALTLQGAVEVLNIDVADGKLVLDGAFLLKPAAEVFVADVGTLTLLRGDQSINRLTGSGLVELGANRLRIENGGEFTGDIVGDGIVDVRQGDFTVDGMLNSVDAVFQVQSTSMTEVTSTAELNVGTLEVLGTMVLQGDSVQMARVTGETASITGTLKGTGMLSAATRVHDGGRLSPGASPGHLHFADLILASGSTTSMELYAGPIDDQITVNAGGAFTIEGTSALELASSYSLPKAEITRIFNFDTGSVQGFFGSAAAAFNATTPSNQLVLNLATGSVVGLGGNTLGQLKALPINQNQRNMVAGMLVNETGGVGQFYGGRFVENLTAAWAANGNLDAVFERASPEVHSGIAAMAQSAALNAVTKWGHSFAEDSAREGTFVDISTTNFSAGDNFGAQMAYGTQTVNATVGFSQAVSDNASVVFNIGTASTKLNGDYTVGAGQGVATGFAVVGRVPGAERLYWNSGFRYADLNADGTRYTNNGAVTFDDVNTVASQFNIGLEYFQASAANSFGVRGNLVFGYSRSDAFEEKAGASNPLDAMSINEVMTNYARFEAGMKLGTEVTDTARIFGALDASMPISEDPFVVGASMDNGQAAFGVNAFGLDAASVSASIGVDRDISEGGRLNLTLGANNDWQGDSAVNASISARFNF